MLNFSSKTSPLLINCLRKNILQNELMSVWNKNLKYLHTTSCLLELNANEYFNNPREPIESRRKRYRTYLRKKLTPKYVKNETIKFYEEAKQSFLLNHKFLEDRHPEHTIDMLFSFENEQSLNEFEVSTDSEHDKGYSSAKLHISQEGTCVFSGVISNLNYKVGAYRPDGFAIMISRPRHKAFDRTVPFDFEIYTHLVFKVRGDGRTYGVVLTTPEKKNNYLNYLNYNHPLYTRGGPYWQITKIPFSYFFAGLKGQILDSNDEPLLQQRVMKLGIVVKDGNNGPFRLEIDYIGLEMDPKHIATCTPYEGYYIGK